MRETNNYYFFWEHQFGQWTKRDIVDPDGVTYNCCEQYMMVKKALLFDDQATAQLIMSEPSPAKQQKLGRSIHHFDSQQWDIHKFGIVWYGNFLKFSQHTDLRERLLKTNNKILAEASPYDLVWGVGLAAEDDRILDQANWTGQNLLGQALISVRNALQNT